MRKWRETTLKNKLEILQKGVTITSRVIMIACEIN